MKFKNNVEPLGTSDFYYDLTDGGYIKPETFLEDEDAKKVLEAIEVIRQFKSEAEELELIFDL